MIITREDRAPDTVDDLHDQLRALGADWPRPEVEEWRRRFADALGGGARAHGDATEALRRLAAWRRRGEAIRDLTAFIEHRRVQDLGEYLTFVLNPRRLRTPPRDEWPAPCGRCDPPTRLIDNDDGTVSRCRSCHGYYAARPDIPTAKAGAE